MVGPYVLEAQLARGGMGAVYRAHDPATGAPVALKVLHSCSAAQQARFEREVRSLTRIDHPGVVRIFATGWAGKPWLAMELVEGRSLGKRLREGGPLPVAEAVNGVAAIAEALDYCHGLGVLHRDIKPDNVLVGPDGRWVLTDFGLALEIESSLTRMSETGSLLGTPGYWPPEQARGDLSAIGPRSDVYGLGALLYALLTGRPPIVGATLAEIAARTDRQAIAPPRTLRSEVSRRLDRICMRALAKDPDQRFGSAGELAAALGDDLTTRPIPRSLVATGVMIVVAGAVVGAVSRKPAPTTPTPAPITAVSTSTTTDAERWFDEGHRLSEAESPDYVRVRELFRKAAEVEHLRAMNRLGLLHQEGKGGPRDDDRARVWFERAWALGDRHAGNNLGAIYERGRGVPKDLPRAAALYREAADLGSPTAMSNLAQMHLKGWGVPKDVDAAVKLLRRGVKLGHGDCMATLGFMHERGEGVPRDLTRAAELYRTGAERGSAQAMFNLGLAHQHARGVPKDLTRTAELFRRSAALGHANAMANLGYLHANGFGVRKSAAQAVKWYRKAAAAGSGLGMNNLAQAYRNGFGVERDLTEEVAWFRRAARAGYGSAGFELGMLYIEGRRVRANVVEAKRWFRLGAELGHGASANELGRFYGEGWDGPKDIVKAVRWFRRAAELGNMYGQHNIAWHMREGNIPTDVAEMVRLFQASAAQGFAGSMRELGGIYRTGVPPTIPRDLRKAVSWFRRAAAGGDAPSKTILAELLKENPELKLPDE